MSNEVKVSIYDLNKNIISQMPVVEKSEVCETIQQYLKSLYKIDELPEFFMLLAAEKRDFTVFYLDDVIINFEKIAEEMYEVLSNRGVIRDITINEDDTIDAWVDGILYKMFKYDWGVIKI
ncbi:MAG: hypothetical protein RR744_09665 [Cellulosilyticaceae bacterium]